MDEIKPFDLLESPLEGINLIEASAGTGKTHTISGLFLRLILEKRFSVNEILVVTFTKAATEEINDRIRGLLKKAIGAFSHGQSTDEFLNNFIKKFSALKNSIHLLTEALRAFDEAAIFTIHGFCQKMLKEHAFESSLLFDTELITQQEIFKQEIIDDFWRTFFYPASPLFVNYALSNKFTPDKLLAMVENYSDKPIFKVIPLVAIPDTRQEESGFEKALKDVVCAWPASKQKVKEIFITHEGLKRTSYRNSSIAHWIDAMDSLVSYPVIFEKFEMFTTSKIEEETKPKYQPPCHPFFDLCEVLKESHETLTRVYDQRLLGLKCVAFDFLQKELSDRKQRKNLQSYNDLLIKLRNALKAEAGEELTKTIRAKYRAALIDEFQDTDPIQYEIFHTIFKNQGKILFLIGDPKQAIYSFRGADIFAYLKATTEVDRKYTLKQNWRSEPQLIEAINTIFSRSHNPFVFDQIHFQKAAAAKDKKEDPLTIEGNPESPLQLWFLDARTVEKTRLTGKGNVIKKSDARELIVSAVGAEILRLLNLGKENKASLGKNPVTEQDIAVLVRTNQEATRMQEVLSALKIPSVLYTMGNLFDTHEATDLEQLLEGIVEPHNERLLKAALATDILGLRGESLETLMTNDAEWLKWVNQFTEYQEMWRDHTFIRMFRYFIFKEKVRSRLLSFPDGERRLTNLLHLAEVLHQESMEKKLNMGGLLKWLSEQRDQNHPRLEEHQLRLETDAHAVKVVTIHKCKGLEYPVTFCPFLWDSSRLDNKRGKDLFTFHDGTELILDLGSAERDENQALAEKENLAENLRLLYVALTRAKNCCYLVWGRFHEAGSSALAYLLHPPENLEGDNIVDSIETFFKRLTDDQIWESLKKVEEDAQGAIHLQEMPQPIKSLYQPPKIKKEHLSVRIFSGRIDRSWKVASFSSLAADHHIYPLERSDYDKDVVSDTREGEEPSGIFSFPRGVKAGSFMHTLFEHLDFTEQDVSLINNAVEDKLKQFGFDLLWKDTIGDMVKKVLSVPLDPEQKDFTLSSIPLKDKLSEFEFYFPLKTLSPEKLKNIFLTHGSESLPKDFPDQIGNLRFSPVRGFMKGFIDLVFQFHGSFYLVDWKSNFLGTHVEDYHQKKLAEVMIEEYYHLQSLLYTVALDKYLSKQVSNYHYAKHFGGVLYLFLRGIDPQKGSEFGIFRSRPRKELIQTVSDNLITLS